MSRKNYPVRIPRYAKGIRMQATRAGADTWWEKRWQACLARKDLGGRLARGRNYALSGQVTEMSLDGSHVAARVVGMREGAYRVTVDFREPAGDARARIVAALRAEPMLVARLLADDLPTEVEEVFRREGMDLFPGGKLGPDRYDMTTACSCPDYANPCKHSDAVLLILGERIAQHPGTLLELRGIRMEELYED